MDRRQDLLSGYFYHPVDLRIYDELRDPFWQKYKVTPGSKALLGDLHAASDKLLFAASAFGFLQLASEKDYDELVMLFDTFYWRVGTIDKTTLTQKIILDGRRLPSRAEITRCIRILDRAVIPEGALEAILLLIGDTTSDRRGNDIWMLLLLCKLRGLVHLPLSNHDIDFIKATERKSLGSSNIHKYYKTDLDQDGCIDHGASLRQLGALIDYGIVSEAFVDHLVSLAYRPALIALSYTLSRDKSEITIEAHTQIDFDLIEIMAKHPDINIHYRDDTPEQLAQTIDKINLLIRELAYSGDLSKLFPSDIIYIFYRAKYSIEELKELKNRYPFVYLVWNRAQVDFPTHHKDKGYKTNLACGHHGPPRKINNFLCLNNGLANMPDHDRVESDYNPTIGLFHALFIASSQCYLPQAQINWAKQQEGPKIQPLWTPSEIKFIGSKLNERYSECILSVQTEHQSWQLELRERLKRAKAAYPARKEKLLKQKESLEAEEKRERERHQRQMEFKRAEEEKAKAKNIAVPIQQIVNVDLTNISTIKDKNIAPAQKTSWLHTRIYETIFGVLILSLILATAAWFSFSPPMGFLPVLGLSALPTLAVFGIFAAFGLGIFMLGVSVYVGISYSCEPSRKARQEEVGVEFAKASLLADPNDSPSETDNCFEFEGWFNDIDKQPVQITQTDAIKTTVLSG